MEKIGKRIRSSYEAYKRYREKYAKSGHGLDRELTLTEYADVHKRWAHDNANNTKKTHIAREIAADEQTFTRNEAASIIRRLKDVEDYHDLGKYEEVNKEEFRKIIEKYKKSKDIYSLNFTEQEAAALEEERRQRLLDRGKEPKYIIQQTARVILFNELRDAGLSYKEADEVLYG